MVVSARDENEQSRFVAQRIAELREEGTPLSEIAVLFRSSSHSFDLEIELGKQGIPFRKFGGIRFAESAHIKDALAFLRVMVKPSDTLSWFRALKFIDHIGDATVYQILEHLGVEQQGVSLARRSKTGLFKKLASLPCPRCLQSATAAARACVRHDARMQNSGRTIVGCASFL